MVQRLVYRRRKSYNTASNKVRKVRTPGGKLTFQLRTKVASLPKCADTGRPLFGIPALRPFEYKSLAKRKRTVQRAYGGKLSASAVRQRIVRAFLVEEHNIVKAVTRANSLKLARQARKAAKSKAEEKKGEKKPAKKGEKKAVTKVDKTRDANKKVAPKTRAPRASA